MDWFLHDNGLRHERVKMLSRSYFRYEHTTGTDIVFVNFHQLSPEFLYL